jgi:4'-phosphopantetheinyl transferase
VRPVLHVFATDLPIGRIAELERLLSPSELTRAGRFHFEAERARFIASHGTLRTLLGHHLSKPPESIEFAHGIHGKPVVAGHPDDIEFSLSRSRELCVVAVTHGSRVGVDIEQVRPLDGALQIARSRFRPVEAAAIDSPVEFFRLWTRKEAAAKCLGWGLALPFDAFEIDPSIPGSERVIVNHQGERNEILVEELGLKAEGVVGALGLCGLGA